MLHPRGGLTEELPSRCLCPSLTSVRHGAATGSPPGALLSRLSETGVPAGAGLCEALCSHRAVLCRSGASPDPCVEPAGGATPFLSGLLAAEACPFPRGLPHFLLDRWHRVLRHKPQPRPV